MTVLSDHHPLAKIPLGQLASFIRYKGEKHWRPLHKDNMRWVICRSSFHDLKGPWKDNCEFAVDDGSQNGDVH